LLGAVLVPVVVLAGWWWLSSLSSSSAPVRVVEYFGGTVSDVNVSGSGICVLPDDGGAKRCGLAYQAPGSPKLSTGTHVRIAREVLKTPNSGVSKDIWLIYDPQTSTD
jgi:hypothetical protein